MQTQNHPTIPKSGRLMHSAHTARQQKGTVTDATTWMDLERKTLNTKSKPRKITYYVITSTSRSGTNLVTDVGNVSWLPEVTDGAVAERRVGGATWKGSKRGPLVTETLWLSTVLMPKLRLWNRYIVRKILLVGGDCREYMRSLCIPPYNYLMISNYLKVTV